MNKHLLIFAIMICSSLMLGCQSRVNQYQWGAYESLLFKMYIKPGEAPPGEQIYQLEQTIDLALSQDGVVPPGLYAHLGFMRLSDGDQVGAVSAFESEKALYPESAVFIDELMKNVSPKKVSAKNVSFKNDSPR